MLLLVTVVAAMVVVAAEDQAMVEVTLKQGAITGSQEEAINGRVYYSFKKIPYAKPPVGPLRFKDPETAPSWSGVRNGSMPIPKCPQPAHVNVRSKTIEGQEDCLYLNVYTPRLESSKLLPVMVNIHAGGFIFGTALEGMSPAPLMQKDVVVVAMNYRLGVLGFLSTGDSVLPGNLGLKDQTLALQWVQNNIMNFGGDPNQVTIFGMSSGGTSAHYHILSPSSAGLFHRAILQSGTALMPNMTSQTKGAVTVSEALNCTGKESQQLLACFMNADMEDLVKTQQSFIDWLILPLPVGPRVDGTFLPDHPANLLRTRRFNRVSVICGTAADDGSAFTTALFSKTGDEALQELNDNFTKTGPILLHLTEEENPVYLARRVFFNYMTNLNVSMDDEFALTSLLGDRSFKSPSRQTVTFNSRDLVTKTFLYELHHRGLSLTVLLYNSTIAREMAGHADEMQYLFQLPFRNLTRQQDLQVQEILITLWTNFASTGDPTVSGTLGFRWLPVRHDKPLHYLSLSTTPTMQPVDNRNNDFWNSLPTKTNKLLFPRLFL